MKNKQITKRLIRYIIKQMSTGKFDWNAKSCEPIHEFVIKHQFDMPQFEWQTWRNQIRDVKLGRITFTEFILYETDIIIDYIIN